MCIRDSYRFIGSSTVFVELGKTKQPSLLKIDKVTKTVTHTFHFFNGVVNPLDNTRRESVSYTHLDVYKRQTQFWPEQATPEKD